MFRSFQFLSTFLILMRTHSISILFTSDRSNLDDIFFDDFAQFRELLL